MQTRKEVAMILGKKMVNCQAVRKSCSSIRKNRIVIGRVFGTKRWQGERMQARVKGIYPNANYMKVVAMGFCGGQDLFAIYGQPT